jgi:hypothetical protein
MEKPKDPNIYWGYEIVDFANPQGSAARLQKMTEEGTAQLEFIYNEMMGADYTIDGFNVGRFSAKLEYIVSHTAEDGTSGEFDGCYIVKALDAGIITFLVPRDHVHIQEHNSAGTSTQE